MITPGENDSEGKSSKIGSMGEILANLGTPILQYFSWAELAFRDRTFLGDRTEHRQHDALMHFFYPFAFGDTLAH